MRSSSCPPQAFRIWSLIGLVSVVIWNPVSAADGDVTPTVNEAMIKLGDEIARYVASEPDAKRQLSIGAFQGPSSSGAGARIVQSLRENLKSKCELVDVGAAYTVSGRFMGKKIDGQFVIVIEAEIGDALGNSVQKLRRKVVTALDEGLAFFGPSSVDLSAESATAKSDIPAVEQPEDDATVTAEKLVSSIVKPQTHLDASRKTRMNPSDNSPYGLEIVVKQADGTYRSLSVSDSDGIATVDLQSDQVYAVRLFNDSPRNVGCRLTIDGLNAFALSLDANFRGKDTIMELRPRGKFLIKGWHHTGDISHEFRISDYGDTPAAKFGVFDGVGMVTATFYEAKVPDGYYATREFATGIGDETQMKYSDGKSTFGKPVAAVSVRYVRPVHPTDLPVD
ncbi:hypothetical protein Poly24_41110 [Rosistilla carotiformis]|uniref:Uncharacterized protein n=1 Tax=Rosistilla carotiformis TaxID=2528017 RepID=A0A518JXW8_9BACT|nr:hypothetical protein [Rosistilla carotiformis]QDV70389.1 hypothetical protein Poly24_41110 [Rosistilla carotiformis]